MEGKKDDKKICKNCEHCPDDIGERSVCVKYMQEVDEHDTCDDFEYYK
ncbi:MULTISPECIES: hypothetical protein [Clostridium]|nr:MULTISPECIES: hypothetical protein [Clostridium]MCB2300577.1 hypothetical protein [Clostridium tagluense]MCB2339094.1 hypothetical protein [Clostridium estertheticum]